MAFFEQIGKKITDAGQGAAQSAKNLADVTKLNSSISDKEKKISQLYFAIGEAFFQAHKGEVGGEQSENIAAINALLAEIDQCREEIKQIKGVTKCPNCGADVKLGAAFCSACGTKME